jgi:hypothetical protein
LSLGDLSFIDLDGERSSPSAILPSLGLSKLTDVRRGGVKARRVPLSNRAGAGKHGTCIDAVSLQVLSCSPSLPYEEQTDELLATISVAPCMDDGSMFAVMRFSRCSCELPLLTLSSLAAYVQRCATTQETRYLRHTMLYKTDTTAAKTTKAPHAVALESETWTMGKFDCLPNCKPNQPCSQCHCFRWRSRWRSCCTLSDQGRHHRIPHLLQRNEKDNNGLSANTLLCC